MKMTGPILLIAAIFLLVGCIDSDKKEAEELREKIEEQQKDLPQGPNDNSGWDEPPLPT